VLFIGDEQFYCLYVCDVSQSAFAQSSLSLLAFSATAAVQVMSFVRLKAFYFAFAREAKSLLRPRMCFQFGHVGFSSLFYIAV